jgi:hypothetical protein
MSLFPPQLIAREHDTHQVGRIGELLAAYYLELYGIQTEIVRGIGSDLWCTTEDGLMFTCEVKTCHTPYMQGQACREESYRFHVESNAQRKADMHALVGLDLMSVKYVLTEDLPAGGKKILKARHLDDTQIFPSIEGCMQRLADNRKAA